MAASRVELQTDPRRDVRLVTSPLAGRRGDVDARVLVGQRAAESATPLRLLALSDVRRRLHREARAHVAASRVELQTDPRRAICASAAEGLRCC